MKQNRSSATAQARSVHFTHGILTLASGQVHFLAPFCRQGTEVREGQWWNHDLHPGSQTVKVLSFKTLQLLRVRFIKLHHEAGALGRLTVVDTDKAGIDKASISGTGGSRSKFWLYMAQQKLCTLYSFEFFIMQLTIHNI